MCVGVCCSAHSDDNSDSHRTHPLPTPLSLHRPLLLLSLIFPVFHPLFRLFMCVLFYSFHSRTFNLSMLVSLFTFLYLLLSLSLSLPISLSLYHTHTLQFYPCSQINSERNHCLPSLLPLPLPLPYF